MCFEVRTRIYVRKSNSGTPRGGPWRMARVDATLRRRAARERAKKMTRLDIKKYYNSHVCLRYVRGATPRATDERRKSAAMV